MKQRYNQVFINNINKKAIKAKLFKLLYLLLFLNYLLK